MGREYGAVERDSGHPGPPSASGGGWPSWWRGARGCASFFGTRESVLAGNVLLEAQAAMVVSACVATLSNGLFHHDSSARVDPSLPWSEQRAAVAAGANSPTFVSLVSVTAHLGYVCSAPIVGMLVELIGFPAMTAIAAAMCPLVASGYAATNFRRVSWELVRMRLIAGAWKATHELSTASANAIAWTPASSPFAFGAQNATWSVFSVAAPFAISLLLGPLGVPGVFIVLSTTGFAAFCAVVLFSLTPWMAHQGRLPPRAPCAPLLDNADDDDDEGGGALGGADDAKDAVDLRARLIEAGGASSSAEASPEKDRGISGIPIEDNGVTYSMSGPKPGTSWASTCVSMLRDPETFCVVAVSAAMGTAEYSIAGAVMMLLSGVMSFGGAGCAMFLAIRELPDVAVQLGAPAYLRAVPVWMTFGCGLGLAAGGTGALAALGAGAGDDGVDDGTRRLVMAAGCFHGLGVGMVKVAVLPAMSQLVEDRHGSMFGVGLGVQGFATKLAGGAVGMVGLSFLIESVGFTRALSFFAAALAVAAVAAGWFARGIKLRVEASRDDAP